MITPFCAEYLRLQGIIIIPAPRTKSAPVKEREPEFVPVVQQYERGDLP